MDAVVCSHPAANCELYMPLDKCVCCLFGCLHIVTPRLLFFLRCVLLALIALISCLL